jgi:DNA polymerase III subunit epsilon
LCGRGTTGQRLAHVAGKILDADRVQTLTDGVSTILAHNAAYDRRMVVKLYPQLDQFPWHCTMNGVDWIGKGCSSRRLADICALYDVGYAGHHAAQDIEAVLALLGIPDQATGRPLLYDVIQYVPLDYVSRWQVEHK